MVKAINQFSQLAHLHESLWFLFTYQAASFIIFDFAFHSKIQNLFNKWNIQRFCSITVEFPLRDFEILWFRVYKNNSPLSWLTTQFVYMRKLGYGGLNIQSIWLTFILQNLPWLCGKELVQVFTAWIQRKHGKPTNGSSWNSEVSIDCHFLTHFHTCYLIHQWERNKYNILCHIPIH